MSGGEIEFLGGGPERGPRLPGRPHLPLWRPRGYGMVFLVSMVAAAVWAGYATTAPRIPSVRVAALAGNQASAGQESAPWQSALDGRPVNGVELQVNAVISAPPPPR